MRALRSQIQQVAAPKLFHPKWRPAGLLERTARRLPLGLHSSPSGRQRCALPGRVSSSGDACPPDARPRSEDLRAGRAHDAGGPLPAHVDDERTA